MEAQPDPLTTDLLGPYLERSIVGFRGLQHIEKFNTGQSNPTYKLTAASGTYVLRAQPPGKLLKSAHQVDREFRVMSALRDTDVPVPEVFHLATEDSPLGRDFFVMEFLEGRIFWDPALPELTNQERTQVYDRMNEVLAALHSVDLEKAGLTDFGRPGSYYERQLARWTKQYRASELEPIPAVDELIGWLEANLPGDDGMVSLVHGDYRIDNMVFAKDEIKVIGVLDWELSTLGHPFADLAYQCMHWRLPHEEMRGLLGIDRKALGIPLEEDYVAHYRERRGLAPIKNWTFYLVFSVFRFIAILQGVVKRAHDGNASNPQTAERYKLAIPFLAHGALDIIKKG